MHKILFKATNGCMIFGSLLVLFLSVGGFVSDIHWTLGWYSHPRPQFFVASILIFGWLAWQKMWYWSAVPLTAVLLNGMVLAPFFFGSQPDFANGQQTLSILHLNTNKGEADLEALDKFWADIIFLQEVTPELEARLNLELPEYEIAISHPLSTTQGIVMLVNKSSSFETTVRTIRHLPWYNYRPLITAKLELDGRRLHLMSLHTSRPHEGHADAFQLLEIDAAAEWSRIEQDFGHEVILIGDLNLTPWSKRYKHFLEASRTQDSMVGYGIQNSWAEVVPQWMGLPIDHALVSNGLNVIERQTTSVEGSDHGLVFLVVVSEW